MNDISVNSDAVMQGSPPPREVRITLENWDRPPFNRWSFQHVREIMPTVAVDRGAGPPSEFRRDHQALEEIEFTALDGATKSLGTLLAESFTDGFLVLHHGAIVTERYFNAMTERTPHLSQSVAKSVVGTLAGILTGRGLIDPAQPLTDHVPELAASGYRGATVQQVLDMRSGVKFSEVYTDPASDVARIDRVAGWKPRLDPSEPDNMYDLILSLEQARAHGGPFEYRSIETDVLGWALERAAGLRLADLVARELWAPLGAEQDAYFTVDRAGNALADGGFNATLRDYARFGQMHLDRGHFNGRRIVPAEWTQDCRNGDHSIFGEPYTEVLPGGAYRNCFWIEEATRRTTLARGVFGQLIYICPHHDLVAVKLSTWPDYQNTRFGVETLRALYAVGEALGGPAI
jgi:CubicO group peptidase (beta-lactamase class C family)